MCSSQMDFYALERARWTLLVLNFDFLSWPYTYGLSLIGMANTSGRILNATVLLVVKHTSTAL